MEGNLHLLLLRLLWRAPEDQRLINASDHNLLAAVQVAFDNVCVCAHARETLIVLSHFSTSVVWCEHKFVPDFPDLICLCQTTRSSYKGHDHE